jgi:hypothetical protein
MPFFWFLSSQWHGARRNSGILLIDAPHRWDKT